MRWRSLATSGGAIEQASIRVSASQSQRDSMARLSGNVGETADKAPVARRQGMSQWSPESSPSINGAGLIVSQAADVEKLHFKAERFVERRTDVNARFLSGIAVRQIRSLASASNLRHVCSFCQGPKFSPGFPQIVDKRRP